MTHIITEYSLNTQRSRSTDDLLKPEHDNTLSKRDFEKLIIHDDIYRNIDVHSFQIEYFLWNKRKYILKKSVICNVEYKDKLWIYKVPYYGLHSFSEDKEEALGDLNEEFAFLCNDLLNEKDENLTSGAIKLRNLIKNNLNEIL